MDICAVEQKTLESTASILMNNLIRALNDRHSSPEDLSNALKPFSVIQWSKSLIVKLDVDKINRIFGRLKRSGVDKALLRLIIDHFHDTLSEKGGRYAHSVR